MNWFTGVVVYVVIWWITIFWVLNWGHRTSESPEIGHARSAPVFTNWRKKFLVNTVIAGMLWLALYAIIKSDVISFERMVR